MNRSEFVAAVADGSGLTQGEADKALDAMLEVLSRIVSSDDKLTIPGYLTVQRAHRAARNGRNPQTGSLIKIAARRVAKFTPGIELKKVVARGK